MNSLNDTTTAEYSIQILPLKKIKKMRLDIVNSTTCSVSTSIEIAQTYHIVNSVFDSKSPNLAELYKPWKRCLAVVDHWVHLLYGDQIKSYFEAYNIAATVQSVNITEDKKSVETLLEICSWITDFDILRREPVLVIGGGLVTDVVGLLLNFLIFPIKEDAYIVYYMAYFSLS